MTQPASNVALRVLSTVSTLSELGAINTALLQDGASVFVSSERSYYALVKTAVDPAIGKTIIVARDGQGRWFRWNVGSTSSLAMIEQDEWHIHPDGDDNNSGLTEGSALRTELELSKRIWGAIVNPTTVFVHGDMEDTDMFVGPPVILPAGQVRVLGAGATELLPGAVLQEVVEDDPATNTRGYLEFPVGVDVSPFIEKRVRCVSGQSPGTLAFIEAVGATNNIAYISPPGETVTHLPSPFVAGDTVVIEELTKVGRIGSTHTAAPDATPDAGGPLVFEDIRTPRTNLQEIMRTVGSTIWKGCDILFPRIHQTAFYSVCRVQAFFLFAGAGFADFHRCSIDVGRFTGGLFYMGVGNHVISQLRLTDMAKMTAFSPVGFFDWTGGAALILEAGCVASSWQETWGMSSGANTYGINVHSGAHFEYSSNRVPTVNGALAGSRDVEVGGVDRTYAQGFYINPDNAAAYVIRAV